MPSMSENASGSGAGGDEPGTSWDDRLLPLLSEDWQSTDALAARLHAKPFTVLARLKDMMRRNLVERRIVQSTAGKKHAGRPLQQAEFRRVPLEPARGAVKRP
jgi:predicted ArsR family transcriptional regulator